MRVHRRELFWQLGATAALTTFASPFENLAAGPEAALVRLNRNESPYGPSEKAKAAFRESLAESNRFPDREVEDLRAAVARFHGVEAENITLGCGSTELLRMAGETWLAPKKSLVMAEPSFEAASDVARLAGAEVHAIPLTHNYAHDLAAMRSRIGDDTVLVYLCNPNNPTGTLTPKADLDAFLSVVPAHVRVLIDEAYHEYVTPTGSYTSWCPRAVADPRLIVTRTFSKIHGLAGLRIGYAVSTVQTARELAARRLPMAVSSASARTALAALSDSAYVRKIAALNTNHRQEFFNQTNARMLRWIDSQTNFVLVAVDRPGKEIAEALRSKGIIVASGFPRFDKYIRVSLGSTADMNAFWRAWDSAMPHHPM